MNNIWAMAHLNSSTSWAIDVDFNKWGIRHESVVT